MLLALTSDRAADADGRVPVKWMLVDGFQRVTRLAGRSRGFGAVNSAEICAPTVGSGSRERGEAMAMTKQPVSRNRTPSSRKRTSPKGAAAPFVTHDDIARRAYELYVARGDREGDALADWFRAERELSGPMP
jgi:hypothetical protein